MAGNEPGGDGHRIGAVKKRSQLKTKIDGEEHWTKRDKGDWPVHGSKAGRSEIKRVRGEK